VTTAVSPSVSETIAVGFGAIIIMAGWQEHDSRALCHMADGFTRG
jgi:hypothetical protein